MFRSIDQTRVRYIAATLPGCRVDHLIVHVQGEGASVLRAEKLDGRSVIEAGGHDLFMNVTVTGHDVDSTQTEVSSTGSSAHASLVAR